MHRTIRTQLLILAAYPILWGCAAQPTPTASTSDRDPRRHPVALIDARAIEVDALTPAMSELAGDEAMSEFVLDRALTLRCEQQGIRIDNAAIDRERVLLAETLGEIDAQANAPRVLNALRARRGLGPHRYERLLRRNAMLRALVGSPESLDPGVIQRAQQQAFGTRYRIRLYVSETPQAAANLHAQFNGLDGPERRLVFSDACFDTSVHPSRDRGGLIDGLSADSPGYPAAVLDALRRLEPGAFSGVLSTEAGYALVYLESITPATEPTESQRRELHELLKRDAQRLAMQRLARQLLDEHEIIVLDESLNWAWANRP